MHFRNIRKYQLDDAVWIIMQGPWTSFCKRTQEARRKWLRKF